ncbi:hypothetical protein, partial [Xanthomonas perforans]|uniref:hypothetical protein n=1 Tax=Xanthomonas perforans TaxID=442694 RepID=UPI002300FB6D
KKKNSIIILTRQADFAVDCMPFVGTWADRLRGQQGITHAAATMLRHRHGVAMGQGRRRRGSEGRTWSKVQTKKTAPVARRRCVSLTG